eukprot:3023431-Rhodomonas_salina.4
MLLRALARDGRDRPREVPPGECSYLPTPPIPYLPTPPIPYLPTPPIPYLICYAADIPSAYAADTRRPVLTDRGTNFSYCATACSTACSVLSDCILSAVPRMLSTEFGWGATADGGGRVRCARTGATGTCEFKYISPHSSYSLYQEYVL